MAAALLPPAFRSLAFLKPSIGIASYIYKPNIRAITIILIVVCLSLLIIPLWPVDWLIAMLSSGNRYISPLLYPGGFLLLLSLISIKRREGRTLFAMSVVPRHAYWYDGVLLWLMPRNFKHSLALSILGWVAYFIWKGKFSNNFELTSKLNASIIWQFLFMYIPVLIMVIYRDLIGLIKRIIPQ